MNWLPSFVKLFLIFVAGLVLSVGGIIAEMESIGSYAFSSIGMALRLLGLLLMVVSPLLIALKFFAQMDKKDGAAR
ncbi:hypothetical protein [Hymenobacter sp. BT559]|uniref:hypothetical protein n=1 Tax=Hymenobacter sp. BT559 TaxID=2795729 RepID=UPI0018EC8FD8|nr:hypothetical protein [Hymenobacter sp. BT559]MBJ6142746.1 hypothetical protein [Hymenobacter sp. BT559]